MEKLFEEKTTADIEAKLYRDILEHENKIEKIIIVTILLLIFLFRGCIIYWLKFGIAIPDSFTGKPISTIEDPIQINYTDEESSQKTFMYKSLINGHNIKIIPKAKYELSGLTVAFNHDFLFLNDFFDSAALYDLGSAWGNIGEKQVYDKYFKSYSEKTQRTGSRILWTSYKVYPAPISLEYAKTHWSHSHLVPANRNIMAALLKIKLWDKVKIDGDLIDMEYKHPYGHITHYKTSLSRDDSGTGDRGYGSCETIYVKTVQIGNTIYK